MRHEKFPLVLEYTRLKQNPLLEGVSGSGKTTVAEQVAEEMKLSFNLLGMTNMTSVGDILGFKSVDGRYIPTVFRESFENGGVFLLDEVDAADPNTLLCLNTMANGYVAFPDKRVMMHKDFHLILTANPVHEGSLYTGRNTLDFSSKNRWKTISMPTDHALEERLTSKLTATITKAVRKCFKDNAISQTITMRDAIRYHVAVKNDMQRFGEDPVDAFTFAQPQLHTEVKRIVDKLIIQTRPLSDAKNMSELYQMVQN